MENNKENFTTLSIVREYDKLCILENIIKHQQHNNDSIRILESIISNFIDSMISNQENNRQLYLNLLNQYIHEPKILNFTIELCISIAKDIPTFITVEINQNNSKFINNFKKNNMCILNLF